MRVAYFTGGTVGAGHLVRGIALGRALARGGVAAEYRMFGPALPFPAAARPDYEVVEVPVAALGDPTRAPETPLARTLAAYRADLLVVDLFWAPLRWLPLPGVERWLLVRTVPRAWFAGPPGSPFDAAQHRRVIAIEPFRHAAVRESVDPVVVANPDECRAPDALRARLDLPAGTPVVVATHAGLTGEIDAIASGGAAAARFDLHDPAAPFPLCEWLPGADRVLAAAGYNSFWEARWLGYFARTRFTPLARRIDDQAWRLRSCAGYAMRANGADTLGAWIAGRRGP